MADRVLKPAVLLNAGVNRRPLSGVWAGGFFIGGLLICCTIALATGQTPAKLEEKAPATPHFATPRPAMPAITPSAPVPPADSQSHIPAAARIVARPTIATPAKSSTRTLRMTVTAYCACSKCCGANARGITASGKPVTHNGGRFVAADPRLLKLGTRLQIPGYHGGAVVPVIDTGGAIKGHRLDVFFPTHAAALQWGRQTLDVVVAD